MESSNELKDLALEAYAALGRGDSAFFEACFARHASLVAIGTDPQEWWAGYDNVIRVFKTQMKEIGRFSIEGAQPQAYREGSLGWAADRPTFRLADGTVFTVRMSVVFHQETAGWKIVHWHASLGTANEEVLGKTLTTQ